MIKKLIVVGLMILGTLSFADGKYEIQEERLEKTLTQEFKYSKGEFDVDIYDSMANIKLEINQFSYDKNMDVKSMEDSIKAIVKRDYPEIKDLNFTVEVDKTVSEDEIVYTNTVAI